MAFRSLSLPAFSSSWAVNATERLNPFHPAHRPRTPMPILARVSFRPCLTRSPARARGLLASRRKVHILLLSRSLPHDNLILHTPSSFFCQPKKVPVSDPIHNRTLRRTIKQKQQQQHLIKVVKEPHARSSPYPGSSRFLG